MKCTRNKPALGEIYKPEVLVPYLTATTICVPSMTKALVPASNEKTLWTALTEPSFPLTHLYSLINSAAMTEAGSQLSKGTHIPDELALRSNASPDDKSIPTFKVSSRILHAQLLVGP